MQLFKKLREKLSSVRKKWSDGISSLFSRSSFDENFWDELEEKLISGDTGVDVSDEIIEYLKAQAKSRKLTSPEDLRDVFINRITSELDSVPDMGKGFEINAKPKVLLMIGVNGSGKTTSAGKLALKFKSEGKKVIMAAADTFRAAAVDQLKLWGEKSGVRVVAQSQGSDPAAVSFDAFQAAKSSGADLLIVDTAGRLHDKHNLMEELKKIHRVLLREAGEKNLEVVLVLDAVLGQNSVAQAETFNEIIPVNSIILTKYDNTSKGGVIISIARKLRVPIRYIGLGEGAEDLSNFDSQNFARALLEKDSQA